MPMCFILILAFSDLRYTVITDTGVFRPYFQMAVTGNKHVFIVDADLMIRHWDASGVVVNRFGGRGQGPGEMLSCSNIGVTDDQLWIWDRMRSGVHLFDLDGHFLRFIHSEQTGRMVSRTENGWISARLPREPGDVGEIFSLDEDLASPEVFYRFEPEWIAPPKVVHRDRLQETMPINPAKEHNYFSVDQTGTRGFLVQSGPRLVITIFDLVEREIVREIVRDEQPIPFDKDWGREQISSSNSVSRTGFRAVLSAPDSFPIVRGAGMTADGFLILELWTASPDTSAHHLILDESGDEARLPYSREAHHRLVRVVDDIAFSKGYEDGEAIVLVCGIDQLDRVISAHPTEDESEPKGQFLLLK